MYCKFADRAITTYGCLSGDDGRNHSGIECWHKKTLICDDYAASNVDEIQSNIRMPQQNSTSLSNTELAVVIARHENKLRERPHDLRPLRPLLKLLDYQSPNALGNGIYSRCQRALQSQSQNTILNQEKLDNENLIEIINKLRTVVKKFGLDKNIAITQNFSGTTGTINGKIADCDHYLRFFRTNRAIVGTCFHCYKVQILPDSLVSLIRLYFLMKIINFERDNMRKCMVEIRENVTHPYKGYIYCQSESEAIDCRSHLISELDKFGLSNVRCRITHGCTEYGLEYPEFKYSADGAHRHFDQPEKWKELEEDLFVPNTNQGMEVFHENTFHVTLRDMFCLETWIKYASLIGDNTYLHFDGIPLSNTTDVFVQRIKAQAATRNSELAKLREGPTGID